MKDYSKLIIALIIVTLVACQPKNDSQNIEKTIVELANKFPQLPKGNGKQTEYYKLVRSVSIENNNIQIQLRSAPDSIEDPQQIIIITNLKGQHYAIPFLSNSYRDYWNFQFDTPIPNLQRTNTTFEKELKVALDTLNLNDTIGTAGKLISELLFSVLHCRTIYESDSSALHVIHLIDNNLIPVANTDSCFVRLKKNYKAISDEIHPKDYIDNYNAFWDKENGRIYQISNRNGWRRKLKLSIKVYREDCVSHSIRL